MHALTAAHRTLPLGSTVRVTNLKTGHFTVVRITDRGPFVEGRIVDLSLAAAKQADIWQAGVAKVRLEVLRTPVPFDHGGRWAVQIGSFPDEGDARYPGQPAYPALQDRQSAQLRQSGGRLVGAGQSIAGRPQASGGGRPGHQDGGRQSISGQAGLIVCGADTLVRRF